MGLNWNFQCRWKTMESKQYHPFLILLLAKYFHSGPNCANEWIFGIRTTVLQNNRLTWKVVHSLRRLLWLWVTTTVERRYRPSRSNRLDMAFKQVPKNLQKRSLLDKFRTGFDQQTWATLNSEVIWDNSKSIPRCLLQFCSPHMCGAEKNKNAGSAWANEDRPQPFIGRCTSSTSREG
jgi:hypothetical protein